MTEAVATRRSRLVPLARITLGVLAAIIMWYLAAVALAAGYFADGIGPGHADDVPPPDWYRPATSLAAMALIVCSGPVAALIAARRVLLALSLVPVALATIGLVIAR